MSEAADELASALGVILQREFPSATVQDPLAVPETCCLSPFLPQFVCFSGTVSSQRRPNKIRVLRHAHGCAAPKTNVEPPAEVQLQWCGYSLFVLLVVCTTRCLYVP
jgi:hypothetical protein